MTVPGRVARDHADPPPRRYLTSGSGPGPDRHSPPGIRPTAHLESRIPLHYTGHCAWPHGSKKLARELCRQIIRDCPDGLVTGPYKDFMTWLLARHPHSTQKIGTGIAYITISTIPEYPGARGFTVHRTDGSSTDFSWLECITPASHRTRVLNAMREAVRGQSRLFKQAEADAGRLYCAVTGIRLAWNEAQIDHLPPLFAEIADAFIKAAGGYNQIQLLPSADNMIGQPLEPAYETAWAWYHQQNARFQVLSRVAHKELTRQQQQQDGVSR